MYKDFLATFPFNITSGEGGIRTHGALRLTRSPSARTRPDYATSPNNRQQIDLGGENYTMADLLILDQHGAVKIASGCYSNKSMIGSLPC